MSKYIIKDYKLALSRAYVPKVEREEVLIKVVAIGINRADLYQIQGTYPIKEGEENVPGLEVSGTIEKVGSQVSKFKINDRVIALLPGGGYSEYVKVDQNLVIKFPDEISFVEAASILEVYSTVYYNLVKIGHLSPAKKVLITAGASGVGSAAIQLAKVYEAQVSVLVSNREKADYCRQLGADQVFVYEKGFQLKGNYDLVLDMYGGEFMLQYIEAASVGAKIITIALLKNQSINIKLAKLLFKNISIIGSTLKNQSIQVKNGLLEAMEKEVIPLFLTKSLKFTIDSTFSYNNIQQALSYIESGNHKGKVVVSLE